MSAFRARARRRSERRVKALEGIRLRVGWTDGDLGHGPAFRFHDPTGT